MLFCRWAEALEAPASILDMNPDDPPFEARLASGEGETAESCWWIVDICAWEVTRFDRTGAVRFENLRRDQIMNDGRPTSRLRARIDWMRCGAGAQVTLDIGTGVRLAIESPYVNVNVIGPGGTNTQQPKAIEAFGTETIVGPGAYEFMGGFVLDTIVTCEISRCTSTNADRTSTLTQTILVPANTSTLVEVPSRAQELVVSQPAPGALAPLEFVMDGAPSGATASVRSVYFSVDDVRSSNPVLIPKDATHISTGVADPLNDRIFTFVWDLEI